VKLNVYEVIYLKIYTILHSPLKDSMMRLLNFILSLCLLVGFAQVHAAGALVSSNIWIDAEIHTTEKGIINAVWRLGGDAKTARGDRVIWGYFYASPNDVTWGSRNNPDVYVKIWYDVSGRIDVNFFHVSVPDITVYSAKNDGGTLVGTTTTDARYARHSYHASNAQDATVIDTRNGEVLSVQYQAENLDNAFTQSIINTEEAGNIRGVVKYGGAERTARGDTVAWGYFYADSKDVAWGSEDNPEAFIKIWFDVSGRVDVNFFHVSVPGIQVESYLMNASNNAITSSYRSTITMAKRYSRHEYLPFSRTLAFDERLVGLWDWDVNDPETPGDQGYDYIQASGEMSVYDYLGDAYDQGEDCYYVYDLGTLRQEDSDTVSYFDDYENERMYIDYNFRDDDNVLYGTRKDSQGNVVFGPAKTTKVSGVAVRHLRLCSE
jgi:hypothetical protein